MPVETLKELCQLAPKLRFRYGSVEDTNLVHHFVFHEGQLGLVVLLVCPAQKIVELRIALIFGKELFSQFYRGSCLVLFEKLLDPRYFFRGDLIAYDVQGSDTDADT